MTIKAIDVARMDDRPLWVEISGDEVWWDEPRPHEGGRRCVVRRTADGRIEDVLPAGWNARNRVMEYGGRSWRAHRGRLIFTEWTDGRLYVCDPGGEPVPLTEARRPDGTRRPAHYADLIVHGDEVWCVREIGDGLEVERDIVAVPLDGAPLRSVIKSHHFLMNPRVSPDGRQLAFIGWNHPHMPWDATELCVAPLDPGSGTAGPHRVLAAGASTVQAEWRDSASLYAVIDRSGWWNIHLVGLDGTARNLTPLALEFGDAPWKIGSTFFTVAGGRVVAMYGTADERRLGVLDGSGAWIEDIGGDHTFWAPTLSADGTNVVGVAASPRRPYEVVRVGLDGQDGPREVLSAQRRLPPAELLPIPEPVTIDGVHAHIYPPRRPGQDGPAPYVLFVHGGPTGSVAPVFDLEAAYFTSRGIGVVKVNYGGSTGYGRAYRERLRHNWGVVDVLDCETVARWLMRTGRAERVAIRGGSAGGWTALAALTHSDAFCGAVSFYGISDPEGWETHDFESRYAEGLIGPLPEARQRYLDRSPIRHAAAASGPALLMHGLEDLVVRPSQSERFVAALAAHGGRWAYLTFPGEQHGWRREETIVTALEAELAFYGLIFGFPTPEVPPLTLEGPDE